MSESKHTPGPWSVFIDDSGGKYSGWPLSVDAKSVHEDCMVVRTGGQWPYEWDCAISQREAVANAHLIAAAPDMLVALEESLMYIERDETAHGRKFRVGDVVRSAISKAKGESK